MLLMKQARAFGVGVVLSTQNPVDVDYKAISNAGTWMVGRLQTERDKQRLLDGMSAAAGTVDVGAVGDTISGLAKREFVLRRAGKDQPEVFTTRWAMSYLRGPMTRDQIAQLMRDAAPAAAPARRHRRPMAPPSGAALPAPTGAPAAGSDSAAGGPAAPATARAADPDLTPVMPEVGGGIAVRWVDPAARGCRAPAAHRPRRRTPRRSSPASPCATTTRRPTSSTTSSTRRCCTRWRSHVDVTTATAVDYDDRDLRDAAPCTDLLPDHRRTHRPEGLLEPDARRTSSTTSRAAWPSRSRRTRA